jgi:mRNA-degrading endonuclease RelE of RelBE toxin-antitoxin system
VARLIVRVTGATLRLDPLIETRNLKSLRPNPAADKELRIRGRYRVLFNLEKGGRLVVVVAVGEKRGAALLVRGKEYRAHHENRPS